MEAAKEEEEKREAMTPREVSRGAAVGEATSITQKYVLFFSVFVCVSV